MIRKQQNPNGPDDFQMPYRTDTTKNAQQAPTGLIGLLRQRKAAQPETEQADASQLPPGVSLANPSDLNRLALLGAAVGFVLLLGGILSIGLLVPAMNGPQASEEAVSMVANGELGNLKRLQSEMGPGGLVMGPRTALAQSSTSTNFTDASIKRELHDPIGRSNPFDPLVHIDVPGVVSEEKKEKRDVLLDLQYTGFIGDAYSREKLAIIRYSDPMGSTKTLLKKVGDAFLVEGERASINAISREGVRVILSGQKRWLALQPYTETAPVTPAGQPTSIMPPTNFIPPTVPGMPNTMALPGGGGVNVAGTGVGGNSNTSAPPSGNVSSEGTVLRE